MIYYGLEVIAPQLFFAGVLPGDTRDWHCRGPWGSIVNSSAGIMSILVPWNTRAICTYAHWAFPASIAWAPKSELMPAALDAKALEGAPSEGGRTWGKQTKAWVAVRCGRLLLCCACVVTC